jgi:pimeloyl-ACP methyl ester carboxylesterase
MMPQLAESWRVVAPDLRGHGLSDHIPDAYRVRDYADDVRNFLHAIGGEAAVLAGHSLGGLVAACTASCLGNGLRGVFLEDPPVYKASVPAVKDTDSFHFFVKLRDILRHHAETDAAADDLVASIADMVSEERLFSRAEQLHQLDPRVLDAVIEGQLFEGFNPDEALPKISCPTYLLAGQYNLGGAMDAADVQRVVSRIPNCTYAVLEGVGHDIHHEWPREYMRELTLFLANLSQA